MKRYEAMFLFDNTTVHQWPEMEAEVARLFERIGAEQLVCVKFDERKLAYEINKRKRGTYVLTYFDADPNRINDLERDVRLSEVVLRVMVLKADKLTEARLAELKAWPPEQPLQPIGTEGRRGEGGPRDRRDHGDRPQRSHGQDSGPAPAAKPEPAPAGDAPATEEKPAAEPTPEPPTAAE